MLYGIIKVKYKGDLYPVLLNSKDFLTIRKYKKKFYVDKFGQVYCIHEDQGIEKKIYIHHIVVALNDPLYLQKINSAANTQKKIKLYHNNNIYLDNRFENLSYDKPKAVPKARIITFEDNIVTPSMLPLYVSYMKPNNTHGPRFIVKFDNISWKSSGSNKLSLKYKLEQTKKFLREILKCPEIYNSYYKTNNVKQENKSLNTYYTIVKRAGFTHIKRPQQHKSNTQILRYDAKNLTIEEKKLIKNFVINVEKFKHKTNHTINPTIP